MLKRKNVILVLDKKTGKFAVYSSLVGFVERNEGYSIETLNYWLSRKKKPFEDDKVKISRVPFHGRL